MALVAPENGQSWQHPLLPPPACNLKHLLMLTQKRKENCFFLFTLIHFKIAWSCITCASLIAASTVSLSLRFTHCAVLVSDADSQGPSALPQLNALCRCVPLYSVALTLKGAASVTLAARTVYISLWVVFSLVGASSIPSLRLGFSNSIGDSLQKRDGHICSADTLSNFLILSLVVLRLFFIIRASKIFLWLVLPPRLAFVGQRSLLFLSLASCLRISESTF